MSAQPRNPVTFTRFKFSEPVPAGQTAQVTAIQIGLHQQYVSNDQAYWWPGDTQNKSSSGYVPTLSNGVSGVDVILVSVTPPPPAPPPPGNNVNVNNIWIAYRLAGMPAGTWVTTNAWQAPESPSGQGGAPAFFFTEIQVEYLGGLSVTLQAQTAF